MEKQHQHTAEQTKNKEVLDTLSAQVAHAVESAYENGVSIIPRSHEDERSAGDVMDELSRQQRESLGDADIYGVDYAKNTYRVGSQERAGKGPNGDDYRFASLIESGGVSDLGPAAFTIDSGVGVFEYIDRKSGETTTIPVSEGDTLLVDGTGGGKRGRDQWFRVITSDLDTALTYSFSKPTPAVPDYHDITNSRAGRNFEARRASAEQKKTRSAYARAQRSIARKAFDSLR